MEKLCFMFLMVLSVNVFAAGSSCQSVKIDAIEANSSNMYIYPSVNGATANSFRFEILTDSEEIVSLAKLAYSMSVNVDFDFDYTSDGVVVGNSGGDCSTSIFNDSDLEGRIKRIKIN